MRKKQIIRYGLFCLMVFLFMAPYVSASWDQMEVIKQDFEISTNPPRDQWYPEVEYNSIDN